MKKYLFLITFIFSGSLFAQEYIYRANSNKPIKINVNNNIDKGDCMFSNESPPFAFITEISTYSDMNTENGIIYDQVNYLIRWVDTTYKPGPFYNNQSGSLEEVLRTSIIVPNVAKYSKGRLIETTEITDGFNEIEIGYNVKKKIIKNYEICKAAL